MMLKMEGNLHTSEMDVLVDGYIKSLILAEYLILQVREYLQQSCLIF